MNPDEFPFEEFFAERLKQKGMSVKKLSDLTGISPQHLTEIVRGNFAALPSAPYVRGYLIRLGEALDFDGEAWWQKVKTESRLKSSGPVDMLPKNRFLRKAPTKLITLGVIALIVVIYFAVQLPKILGKPSLAITNPPASPFTATANLFTLQGTARNADTLSVNGENVPLAPDGSWQKDVLLSNGPNEITVTAQKFLGRSTQVTEEIIYEAPTAANLPAAPNTSRLSPPASSTSTSSSNLTQ
jgi:cytoskeletal protein RodZ